MPGHRLGQHGGRSAVTGLRWDTLGQVAQACYLYDRDRVKLANQRAE